MQYLFLFLLVVISLIIYVLLSNNNIQENFQSINLINNGDFNKGEDVDGLISKEDNFEIIANENPGETSFVLRQNKFNNKSYQTNIDVTKNTNYSLSLWLHTSKYYDGTSQDILEVIGNDNILANKSKTIKTEYIKDNKWINIVYKFNSKNNDKISVRIGALSKFSKGYALYSNLSLRAEIQNFDKFEHTKNLNLLLLFDKSISANKIKTNLGNLDINLSAVSEISEDGLKIKNNVGSIGETRDILSEEFSIIYTYKGEEYERGNLINGSAINDINSGVDIEINNNIGINNSLVITVGSIKTTFDVGIINKLQNYFILYKNREIELYIDGIKINPKNTKSILDKKNKGTCPDGWKYLGNRKCQSVETNKGTCNKIATFKSKLTNEEKEKWAKACNVTWTNCSILKNNKSASNNNSDCNENDKLIYSHLPVMINKDKNLSGFMKSLIIFKRKISSKEISDINIFLTLKNLNKDVVNKIDSVTDRPTLNNTPLTTNNEFSGDCAFDNVKICRLPQCQCINWNKMDNIDNIPKSCKDTVNKYCRNNYSDNMCNRLRSNMCSIKNKKVKDNRENDKKIIKYLKSKLYSFADKKEKKISDLSYKVHSLEDRLKTEQEKVKQMEEKTKNSSQDCKSCESKIDLSKYIRKDNIPCWGCKL